MLGNINPEPNIGIAYCPNSLEQPFDEDLKYKYFGHIKGRNLPVEQYIIVCPEN